MQRRGVIAVGTAELLRAGLPRLPHLSRIVNASEYERGPQLTPGYHFAPGVLCAAVNGRDAGKLLDKVYTNRFSDLKPGRVRYSVLCDEAGIMLDDGTKENGRDDVVVQDISNACRLPR